MRKILFVVLVLPIAGLAQEKPIKRLDPNANLSQTQAWIVQALTKYGTTKTRTSSATVSNVKFSGCSMSFTILRKLNSTSNAVMGTTQTVSTIKQEHTVDITKLDADGVKVSDSLYPEFETLSISWRLTGQNESRVIEMPVKQGSAEPIKFALDHLRTLCPPRN